MTSPRLLMALATLQVPPGRKPRPVIVPEAQTKACVRPAASCDQPTTWRSSLTPKASLLVPPKLPRSMGQYSGAAAPPAAQLQAQTVKMARNVFMGDRNNSL